MKFKSPYNLLVILGATAGGKTALAVAAARRYQAEIISADSRQVYRRMDLGTGKDREEYGDLPCHLIDIVEPGVEYNLFEFQRDCYATIKQLQGSGKLPLICGGTGLYLDAVLRNYRLVEVPENPDLRAHLAKLDDDALRKELLKLKPDQHNRTNLAERTRIIRAIEIALGENQADSETLEAPPITPLVFGLYWPRETLKKRIEKRLYQRVEQGMIAEVEQLHGDGLAWSQLEYYGLEYRLIARYLQGRLARDEMIRQLCRAIVKFAKRQETFFRRMQRQGVEIHWLNGQEDAFARLCEVADGP